MVLKQELTQRCQCGRAIEFPGGQVRVACKCGAVWTLGAESYWTITQITPFRTKLQADEYPRYPRSKKRKAGLRC